MPHIKKEDREQYDKALHKVPEILTKGDLEYCVFQLLKKYMSTRAHRYTTLHEAVYGAIHAAEEYKRLYLDKREDKAIEENGVA